MITGLSSSMEDYLEAIGRLSEAGNIVRVTQLSKPSISAALNKLVKAGLLQHERYGSIELTAEGRRVADDVIRRFLTEILGIDRETFIFRIMPPSACALPICRPNSIGRHADR